MGGLPFLLADIEMIVARRAPPVDILRWLAGDEAAILPKALAGAAPAPARAFGSIAASSPASHRRMSTGGARRATIISMSASRNGRPPIRSGCGPTVHSRWRLLPRVR